MNWENYLAILAKLKIGKTFGHSGSVFLGQMEGMWSFVQRKLSFKSFESVVDHFEGCKVQKCWEL